MSLAAAATVSTTKKITLRPLLRRKLLLSLRTYANLKGQIDALKSALEKQKGVIGALREETGEQSLSLEGFTITQVTAIRKKFNPKKFVTLGGDLEIYNQAQEEVPSKPYEKITVPGATEEE